MDFLYVIVILCAIGNVIASYSAKDLKCLVCRAVVDEMEREIAKVSPSKKVKIGGYGIDSAGNVKEKYMPLARSHIHLSEMMDTICEKMDDYARATTKKTGELKLLRLMTHEGKMNPEISEVDFVQDSDLNKSLKFYCEGIVEEFEENFYEVLREPVENPDIKLCGKAAELCDLEEPNEYNFEENDEL